MKTTTLNSTIASVKNRLLLQVYYYDVVGRYTKTRSDAVKEEITITYDEYMKSTTEDYLEEKAFGSGTKSEYSLNNSNLSDYVILKKVYPEDFDNLSNILGELVDTSFKSISIKIGYFPGLSCNLSDEFISFIFHTFPNIELDFGKIDTWVSLPEGEFRLNNLLLKNINIKSKDTVFNCTDSITVDYCSINYIGSNDVSKLAFICDKTISVSNVYVVNPVYVRVQSNPSQPSQMWLKTSISISNYQIMFEDMLATNKRKMPLLTVANSYNTTINNVKSFRDIPYYPILSLLNGYNYNIVDLIRSYDNIPATKSTLNLSGVTKMKATGLSYVADANSDNNVSFIKFSSLPEVSDYSIMSSTVIGQCLANIVGLKIQKLSLVDVTNSGYEPIKSGMSNVNKLVMNNCSFNCENAKLSYNSGSFTDDKIISTGDATIECFEGSNMSNSEITANNKLYILPQYNASVKFSANTVLRGKKEFASYRSETFESDDTSKNCVLSIDNSQIYGKSVVFKNIDNLRISNCLIDETSKVCFTNISNASVVVESYYRNHNIEFAANSIGFNSSTWVLREMGNNVKFNFEDCAGRFDLRYKPDCPDSQSVINILNSELKCDIQSVANRIVKVSSSNSLGSTIICDGRASITPDMDCADVLKFKIGDSISDSDKDYVLYGTVESKLY